MRGPLIYDWRGHLVEVEFYGASGDLDVSHITYAAEHSTGIVPGGETHALCEFVVSNGSGFWMEESRFLEEAEPIGPGAIQRETGEDVSP